MKFSINIDCTPDEARRFFGLPDITAMQEKMMEEMETKMQDQIKNLDPETFVKTWMPASIESWTELQKSFWTQMGMAPAEDSKDNKKAS